MVLTGRSNRAGTWSIPRLVKARTHRLRACGAAAAAAAALALAPSAALGSATFTYPVNGQTVTLDKKLTFDFRWSLPQGDIYPDVYVGDQPTFDLNNNFRPFESWCGGEVQAATSCRLHNDSGIIPVAGVHYAVIATSDPTGSSDTPNVSPEVRFKVPFRIGLGCAPTAGCEWPRLSNVWYRFGDASYGFPWSDFNIWAWTNGPKLTMGYTLSRGRQVLKRWTRTAKANVLFDVPGPNHLEIRVFDLPGIAAGTPLRVTVRLGSGNASLTRAFTLRAGGGPRRGVSSLVES